MDNIITPQMIDDVIVKEMTIDMNSGNFYKEVDDKTLHLCLTTMWENREEWSMRGITLGES